MNLTFGFITSRPEPEIRWVLDSLFKQVDPSDKIQIIIVDSRKEERGNPFLFQLFTHPLNVSIEWVDAKPTVWQGKHRLTKAEWWAASNARNSIICLAKHDWVSFTDDRCVLAPTWLQAVRDAMAGNYAVFGSYEKRHGMTVENGVIRHGGIVQATDSRHEHCLKEWNGETPHACGGEWAFGCTLALPLEWALKVNGYDENCDGLSMEDVIFGLMLQNNGYPTKFDYHMKIIEDRTPEHLGPAMVRKDKGVSPNDKSHAMLDALKVRKTSSHPINLRQIRADVLAGKPFPAPWGPTHDFWDQQPVSEM